MKENRLTSRTESCRISLRFFSPPLKFAFTSLFKKSGFIFSAASCTGSTGYCMSILLIPLCCPHKNATKPPFYRCCEKALLFDPVQLLSEAQQRTQLLPPNDIHVA